MDRQTKLLLAFRSPDATQRWRSVNDAVMGGVSHSAMKGTDEMTGLFLGTVSLENQGGFASVWSGPADFQLGEYQGLMIRMQGDGKRYKIKLKTEAYLEGMAYETTVKTAIGEWMTTELPFDVFIPTFRGRLLPGVDPLDPSEIRQVGIMISERQEGPFRLEIDWIKAYRSVH